MAKKRIVRSVKTKLGKVVGITSVNKKLAFVFRKNGKNVVGKSRFKNRTTLKNKLKKILK